MEAGAEEQAARKSRQGTAHKDLMNVMADGNFKP
jgi:hypothetical protein